MKHKYEVQIFKDFRHMIVTQFGVCVKILLSDNGTEYIVKFLAEYLSRHCILHQTSCVRTPQQNGVAKRKNRCLLENTNYNVLKDYWSYGVLTTTHLIKQIV